MFKRNPIAATKLGKNCCCPFRLFLNGIRASRTVHRAKRDISRNQSNLEIESCLLLKGLDAAIALRGEVGQMYTVTMATRKFQSRIRQGAYRYSSQLTSPAFLLSGQFGTYRGHPLARQSGGQAGTGVEVEYKDGKTCRKLRSFRCRL